MIIKDPVSGVPLFTLPDNLDCPDCGTGLKKNHRGVLMNVIKGKQYCSDCRRRIKAPEEAKEEAKRRVVFAESAKRAILQDLKNYPEIKDWLREILREEET